MLIDRENYGVADDNEINIQGDGFGPKLFTPNLPLISDSGRVLTKEDKWSPFLTPYLAIKRNMEPGSIKTSIFTLVVAIVGAGTLSIPYAFRKTGLIVAFCMLSLCGLAGFFSLHCLVTSSRFITQEASYRSLSMESMGPGGATFAQVCLLLNVFGTAISYLVATSSILELVIGVFTDDPPEILKRRNIVFIIGFLVVLPLGLFRQMGALRFTSLSGICCVTYLVLIILYEYFNFCHKDDDCFWQKSSGLTWEDMAVSDWESVMRGVPIFVYGYTCHPNVLPLYLELQRRSSKRMHKVMRRGLSFAWFLYLVIGIFGFLTFRSETDGNILTNNFHHDAAVVVGAVGMSISVTFTIPLFVHAFRYNFASLVLKTDYLDTKAHCAVTICMVGGVIAVAAFVDSISTVFGILGSTVNPTICYILPSIFYCQLTPKRFKQKKIISIILAVIFAVLSILSLAVQIKHHFKE